MISETQNLVTPPYKIFLLIALLCFLIFSALFYLVRHRNEIYQRELNSLVKEGKPTFSILKEHFVKYKNQTRYDIFIYHIPDETGQILEVSEIVDSETRKLLRVGDTVECYRKAFWLEGRRVVLSRIKKNKAPFHEFEFMLKFSKWGIFFSLGLFVSGLLNWIFLFIRKSSSNTNSN